MAGPRSPPGPEPRFSAGDEAFEKLFLSHPWERTLLGPMESWQRRVLGYVTMILKWPTPARCSNSPFDTGSSLMGSRGSVSGSVLRGTPFKTW
jgi:hypothetical protein